VDASTGKSVRITSEDAKPEGTYEMLSCQSDGDWTAEDGIHIAFERQYSRLRILYSGDKSLRVSFSGIVLPDEIGNEDAKPHLTTFTKLSPDENGDLFLYGQLSAGSTVNVSTATSYTGVYLSQVTRTFPTSVAYNTSYYTDYASAVDGAAMDALLDLDENYPSYDIKGLANYLPISQGYYFARTWKIVGTEESTTLPDQLFAGGYDVLSVDMSDCQVTTFGSEAFCMMGDLAKITFPPTLAYIGEKCFYQCYDLTTITLGPTVTTIKDNAFKQCRSLKTVILDGIKTDVLEHFSSSSFSECQAIKTVECYLAVNEQDNGEIYAGVINKLFSLGNTGATELPTIILHTADSSFYEIAKRSLESAGYTVQQYSE
jgi:hypothetical protein